MIRKIIVITLIIAIFLIGCQKVEEQGATAPEAVETPSETTPEVSIDSDIAGIDSLDKDLSMEDLDSIESELDEINW